MSAGFAGDGLHWSLYEGCISGRDTGIRRRPYHKNCKCALHKDRRSHCTHSSRSNTVSYPIRRSWSDGCLSLMNSSNSTTSPPRTSPSVAAAQGDIARTHSHLALCKEEDEEEDLD